MDCTNRYLHLRTHCSFCSCICHYYYYTIWMSLVTISCTSLEPAVIPTAQASSFTLQYFPYHCDVPSIAVFCGESIECFPGTASKFFLRLFVTISVAPIIIGIIVHIRFHIRCISVHKRLYYYYYSDRPIGLFRCPTKPTKTYKPRSLFYLHEPYAPNRPSKQIIKQYN